MTVLAPGHFHAALALKRRRPDVDSLVHVFAPAGDDLDRFRQQVEAFNARLDAPTDWKLKVESGSDWLDRFRKEGPGNTALIAGRNKPKIDFILAALESGLNVLADKPWIVDGADLPKLERTRSLTERHDLVAWDMMTERHETTNRILLALVREKAIFGEWSGSPALALVSVHCLRKTVASATLRRPSWWFDESVAGESLADVGTHLADLALLAIAPEQSVRPDDVRIATSRRWPLPVGRRDFESITGLAEFPTELAGAIDGEQLRYAGNGTIDFAIRGISVRVTTRWELDHPGGDWHEIHATGSRCTVHSLQSLDGRRNISIVPGTDERLPDVQAWCARSQVDFPGLSASLVGGAIRLAIPDEIRRDHESLFARVVDDYARLFRDPSAEPRHEWANRLVRYRLTTREVDRCSPAVPPVT